MTTKKRHGIEHYRAAGKLGFAGTGASGSCYAGTWPARAPSLWLQRSRARLAAGPARRPAARDPRPVSRRSRPSPSQPRKGGNHAPASTEPRGTQPAPQGGGAEGDRHGPRGHGRPAAARSAIPIVPKRGRSRSSVPRRSAGKPTCSTRPTSSDTAAGPRSGPWSNGSSSIGSSRLHPPGRHRAAGTAPAEEGPMIVNFEQVNARGEGSRPRVDLNALGALLDRAALGVAMLRAAWPRPERSPAPRPRPWKPRLIQAPCGKSGRSGPDRGAARLAPGDDPHAQTEGEHRRPRPLASPDRET